MMTEPQKRSDKIKYGLIIGAVDFLLLTLGPMFFGQDFLLFVAISGFATTFIIAYYQKRKNKSYKD